MGSGACSRKILRMNFDGEDYFSFAFFLFILALFPLGYTFIFSFSLSIHVNKSQTYLRYPKILSHLFVCLSVYLSSMVLASTPTSVVV